MNTENSKSKDSNKLLKAMRIEQELLEFEQDKFKTIANKIVKVSNEEIQFEYQKCHLNWVLLKGDQESMQRKIDIMLIKEKNLRCFKN
ncbi:MAG: hypothetical protein IPK55_13000 [Streptococcus sp.]|nr:hypothetical protein [Streptococcus sp.]